MDLPYDPEDPPVQPPAGADALGWALAWRIHTEHRPGPDGVCVAGTCQLDGNVWPCAATHLARSGFLDACWPLLAGVR
jgi:hypothetical protein